MSRRKHGLKALGLCFLAALSVMAMSAVSAQAAEWKEAGVKIATNLPIVGEKDSAEWVLDSETAGVKIEILCTTLTVTEGLLKTDGTGLGKLSFSTCQTILAGAVSAVCAPKEPIVAKVKINQFLHNNRDYLLFSPDDGTLLFTEVVLDKVAGCSVGPLFEIKGHAVVEDCTNKFRSEEEKHLIQQVASVTLFAGTAHENSLKFGTKPASILGSENILLENKKLWSGNAL